MTLLIILLIWFHTMSFYLYLCYMNVKPCLKYKYVNNILLHSTDNSNYLDKPYKKVSNLIEEDNYDILNEFDIKSTKPKAKIERKVTQISSSTKSIDKPRKRLTQKSDDNYNEGSPRNIDPWKTLIKKLDKSSVSKLAINKLDNPMTNTVVATVDELQCKHFGICSGCTQFGNFNDSSTIRKAKSFFMSENYNNFNIILYNYVEWRTHVKIAVQSLSKWGGLKFGLYKTGTHDVESIPNCRVHHPRINEAIDIIKTEANLLGVKGYSQDINKYADNYLTRGELRYLQLSLERSTNKVQVVLVWNSLSYKEAEQSLPRLVKKLKSRYDIFHSITVNFQTSTTNAIFNYNIKSWKLLWGLPTVKETIGNANFFFRPQIFRQANLDAFEKGIIPSILKHIPNDCVVAELYSGIGIIGLNVATKAKLVLCSDSNEFVDDVFDSCVESLRQEHREKVFYENLPAEEAVNAGQVDEADVLIVDPPRKGLNEGVMNLLLDKHPDKYATELKRLVYVSCGFEALERDLRRLLESGLWRIKSAEGYVLFPGSDHLETLVVLDRIGRKWL